MSAAFAVFLVGHGLLHLIGVARGPARMLWLASALLLVASAGALYLWPRWWWVMAAAAAALSMAAILPSWTDAKFGSVANVVVVAGVVFGYLSQGPGSLRASYRADVAHAAAGEETPRPVTDADLARLPEPVQRYLRVTGAAGQPRVVDFRARTRGRIRAGRDARWMPLAAEQHNVVAGARARFFYFSASMLAIPVQGYHRYTHGSATMRVKAAALVPVVNASGREMDQSETVTLLNDMCLFAPGSLVDSAITWESIDRNTARAAFSNAGHTIRAELSFNEAGELIDFRSNDRSQASPDGKTFRQRPWSTPLRDYRQFGQVRLASKGEARWHEPEGDYAYIELLTEEVRYNVRSAD